MPSVPAADGTSSAPRPCIRHGSPGGSLATSSGSSDAANASTRERLEPGERAHRVDEATPRTYGARCFGQQVALQRRELGDVVRLHAPTRVGSTAQHAQPRTRRVEQHPVEGRVAHGKAATVGGDRRHRAETEAVGGAGDRADPRRVHVARDHHTVVVHALRCGHRFAAGRGRDVEHAFTRLRIERGRRRPDLLGPGARRARRALRRARRGRPCDAPAARPARAGRPRHRPRAPRSSAAASSRVVRIGFTLSVTAGGSLSRSSVACAASAPSSSTKVCTIQSGWDVRTPIAATSSPAGSGHGGPSRATDRSTPLAKPRARSVTTPTVSPTAACGETPANSWYAPTRNAARTRGRATRADATTPREEMVEGALPPQRAVDEIGDERAVARLERLLPQQLGQRGCASTRRLRRVRARRRRSPAGCAHDGRRATSAAQPGPPGDARHRPLAFGLHLVEHERSFGGDERSRGRDRARLGGAGRSRVGAPNLQAPPADRASTRRDEDCPPARSGRARSRAREGSSSNSSTVSLSA